MLRQKSHRRLLCTVAFAAAPIGAQAAPIVYSPLPACVPTTIGLKTGPGTGDYLASIGWRPGQEVRGNGKAIEATVTSVVKGTFGSSAYAQPFDCTKGGPVFATVDLTRGDAFSINFGPVLNIGKTSGSAVDLTPVFTSGEYERLLLGPTKVFTPGFVTDFNLYLDATSALTGKLLYKDFLGVQVISSESAISPSNAFRFVGLYKLSPGARDLIFDPPFAGSATVNLLASPDPLLPSVPEPGTLALMGAGLTGLLAFWRRRNKVAGGGKPGA